MPFNHRNGRWRSAWVITPAAGEIKGTVKVNVHYFEDGNVQLNTEKTHDGTVKIDAEVLIHLEYNICITYQTF